MIFVSDAAGTESQIKHVSRLLAAQMTALGVGPGVKEIREKRSQMPLPKIGPDSDEERERAEIGVDPIEESRKRKVQLVPAGMTTKKATLKKSLKLGKFKGIEPKIPQKANTTQGIFPITQHFGKCICLSCRETAEKKKP